MCLNCLLWIENANNIHNNFQFVFQIFFLAFDLRTGSVSHQWWLWPCQSMLHDTNWTLCICTAPGEQWSHMGSAGCTKKLPLNNTQQTDVWVHFKQVISCEMFFLFSLIFCASLVLLERFINISFHTAYLCSLAVSCNYPYGFHLSLVLLCL